MKTPYTVSSHHIVPSIHPVITHLWSNSTLCVSQVHKNEEVNFFFFLRKAISVATLTLGLFVVGLISGVYTNTQTHTHRYTQHMCFLSTRIYQVFVWVWLTRHIPKIPSVLSLRTHSRTHSRTHIAYTNCIQKTTNNNSKTNSLTRYADEYIISWRKIMLLNQ